MEEGATAAFDGCTLSDNTAADSGGAIDNQGTVTLSDCTISGNTAGAGGGIENVGILTMTGTTLSGNAAAVGATSITRVARPRWTTGRSSPAPGRSRWAAAR